MAFTIIPRSGWGAKPPKAVTAQDPDDLLGVAIHHFAIPRSATTARGSFSLMRSVQATHMGPGGLGVPEGGNDIAYNFCFDKFGQIFEGRGFRARTGANGNSIVNRTHAAICYMGDSDKDGFPEIAQDAAGWLLMQWFKQGTSRVAVAHGDISPDGTACPGDRAELWVHTGGWKKDLPNPRRVQWLLMDDGGIVDRSIIVPIAQSWDRWRKFTCDSDASRKAHDRAAAEGAVGKITFARKVLL